MSTDGTPETCCCASPDWEPFDMCPLCFSSPPDHDGCLALRRREWVLVRAAQDAAVSCFESAQTWLAQVGIMLWETELRRPWWRRWTRRLRP